ncbi:response regulator [Mesorhizobium loti]|uniref:response regulator n=1 Tax=Rhizobium loti TaxID=381 RepID=UPI00047B75E2|nr:response regulator [Mesorhizobium loti]
MPKLVYVDEQDDQRRTMLRAAILSEEFADGEVQSLDPVPELVDMVSQIEDLNPDVVITDYRLHEYKAGVKYSGIELVAALQDRYRGFPCFVTTGWARDAAGEAASSFDINAIYSKSETQVTGNDSQNALPFFKRVRLKVDAYHSLLQKLEDEHAELKDKLSTTGLTPAETERLLVIDGDLEAMLGAQHSLPAEIKRIALEPLNEIVEKAERLLQGLEKAYRDEAPDLGGTSA